MSLSEKFMILRVTWDDERESEEILAAMADVPASVYLMELSTQEAQDDATR